MTVLQPLTYMNRSGSSVRSFLDRNSFKLKTNPIALNKRDEFVVGYDDVYLPFGQVHVLSLTPLQQ
jgi:peptidyl-tRNA hydrolase